VRVAEVKGSQKSKFYAGLSYAGREKYRCRRRRRQ
jgi:hypothetical protein